MAVGAVCRKTRILDDRAVKGVVDVLILIVTPCLVIDVFQRPFEPEKLASLGIAFAIAIAFHFFLIVVSTLVFKNKILRLAAIFSNAGFMGIPLEQAILGDDGVFFGVVYVVVFNLLFWGWGYGMMKGVDLRHIDRAQLKTVFVNPGTIGLVVGLPLFLLSVRLPEIAGAPIHHLAALNTPLAMLVIGYHLAEAKFAAAIRSAAPAVAAALRLAIFPATLIAALYPLRHHLDKTMMLALVTAASAPVAAMTSMFAAKFDTDVDLSVALVSSTTLLSIASMPAIIALAMALL